MPHIMTHRLVFSGSHKQRHPHKTLILPETDKLHRLQIKIKALISWWSCWPSVLMGDAMRRTREHKQVHSDQWEDSVLPCDLHKHILLSFETQQKVYMACLCYGSMWSSRSSIWRKHVFSFGLLGGNFLINIFQCQLKSCTVLPVEKM